MKIPIVFCFDDNYVIPGNVCIFSLLKNAAKSTFYEIYVFYREGRLSEKNINKTKIAINNFESYSIDFINLGTLFDLQYEVKDFTIENYFRLAIPEYFKLKDKVLYLDCDTIVISDLTNLYNIDISGYAIGAVRDNLSSVNKNFQRYVKKLNVDPSNYFNSGVLLFNVSKINSEGGILFGNKELLRKSFRYVDQDILNIAYQNNTLFLSREFNYTINALEFDDNTKPSIIHYVFKKPWQHVSLFNDLWWEYYRASNIYDENFYFTEIRKQYNNIDKHLTVGRFLEKIGIYKLALLIKRFFTNIY